MRIDVAVVGSGPAGCATAILCRKAGLDVALIALPVSTSRSQMPEILPAAARGPLQSLSLWSEFQQASFPEHHCMSSAWGSGKLTERLSITDPFGAGWYVDRPVFDSWLLNAARQKYCVPVLRARITGFARQDDIWNLTLNGPPLCLKSKLVVDASGRSSAAARAAGVTRRLFDRQICVSARFVPTARAGKQALIEAGPDGWWFSAPLPSGELGVGYFTDPRLALPQDRSMEGFQTLLGTTEHTRKRIQNMAAAAVQTRVASSSCLESPAGDGWFAVGDSALAYDPLASQGLLRALESARVAAAAICESLKGSRQSPRKYSQFIAGEVERFLIERHYFYCMEQRWPDSAFWRARHDNAMPRLGSSVPAHPLTFAQSNEE